MEERNNFEKHLTIVNEYVKICTTKKKVRIKEGKDMQIEKNILTQVTENDNENGTLIIPETVEIIGEYAFFKLQNLTSITIPYTVKTVSDNAFSNCLNLKTVKFDGADTEILYDAFTDCYELENVSLPQNLKEIQMGTFARCKKLKSIDIPEGVCAIYTQAFAECTSIDSIRIPQSVSHISWCIFEDCNKKLKVYYNDDVYTYEELYDTYHDIEICSGVSKASLDDEETKEIFSVKRHLPVAVGVVAAVAGIATFLFKRKK